MSQRPCFKLVLRLVPLAVISALCFSQTAAAQGGPPFRTDDAQTPGNRQWEINVGFIGERAVSEGSYATPTIDLNYGLGDRIQLKFEVPLSIQEQRGGSPQVANSLMGVKWRFYESRAETKGPEDKFSFGMAVYPQLVLNNPTSSVRRGIVDTGPQFLLPIEVNGKLGPIRIVGETGYWFTRKDTPNSPPSSWILGLMVGHEFENKTEVYLELHDEEALEGIARESTIGIGGRQPIARHGRVLILGMGGRSLGAVTSGNGQPNWIAYLGLQFRLGREKQP